MVGGWRCFISFRSSLICCLLSVRSYSSVCMRTLLLSLSRSSISASSSMRRRRSLVLLDVVGDGVGLVSSSSVMS